MGLTDPLILRWLAYLVLKGDDQPLFLSLSSVTVDVSPSLRLPPSRARCLSRSLSLYRSLFISLSLYTHIHLVLQGGNELLALDRFGLQLLEPRHLHHGVCFSVWLGVCDEGL